MLQASRARPRTDFVKQTRTILRHDFHQRAVFRRLVVEIDRGLYQHLGRARHGRGQTPFEQRFEGLLIVHHLSDALSEARDFTGIQFQRPVQI